MAQFKNPALKEALAALRNQSTGENVKNVIDALVQGKVLAPATWDKNPVRNEKGQLQFDPDTKFSLMVLSNQNKELYFPMFSDMESLQAWNPDKKIQSLVLTWDQAMSFVEMAKENVKGIVFNPGTENLPITAQLLIEAKNQAAQPHLNANQLHKGDTVYLRDPSDDVADLKLALETAGQLLPEVNSIYLKERLENPEDKNSGHWFIIVDVAGEESPKIFEKIGHSVHNFAHGKQMEFLFGSAKLAQNIMQQSAPVYQNLQ